MTVIFAVPFAVWRIFRTDSWAPLVVVQIITGILLGPGVLGSAFPSLYGSVFKPEVIQLLNGVAWWAVMLFVWVAGLELNLKKTWENRRETGVTAGLALLMPLTAGAIAALVLGTSGWKGANGQDWQFVTGVGMSCAVTALPILVLFLEKLGLLRKPLGQRILRYASLDDIAIWLVLALILTDWERIGRQMLFIVLYAAASWGIRRFIPRLQMADRWPVALIWLALTSFGADWCGLHFMVGAFLAGVTLEREWFDEEAVDRFRHTVLLVLMPVFFLSTGLRTEWDMGGVMVFGAAALFLVAAVGGKMAGVLMAGKILKWRPGESLLIGVLLQTKALIMIIFDNILLDRGIISPDTFTALLVMAVASTMISIPLSRWVARSHPGCMDDPAT